MVKIMKTLYSLIKFPQYLNFYMMYNYTSYKNLSTAEI